MSEAPSGRIVREIDCITKMVEIYCRDLHGTEGPLCPDCRELLDYAAQRIGNCRFGSTKSVCAKCAVHCFKRDMRARVKNVMRHTGPKMLFRHPVLSVLHFIDGFRKPKVEKGV